MRRNREILIITYAVPEEVDVLSLQSCIDEQQKYWFENHSTWLERWWHERFRLNQFDRECILLETGVGKVNAATALQFMLNQIEQECGTDVEVSVLNLGTAASVHVPIGEVVECSRFVDRDLIQIPYGDSGEKIICLSDGYPEMYSLLQELVGDNHPTRYSCNSGDSFVTNPDEAYQMRDGYTAVCDMEAFAEAKVLVTEGWKFSGGGTRFRSVKYITDQINEDNSVEAWQEELPAAHLELTRAGQEAIREFFGR